MPTDTDTANIHAQGWMGPAKDERSIDTEPVPANGLHRAYRINAMCHFA